MNTHIIIPIKDIREYHTKLGQKELFSRYKNAKQISLDEKDIEDMHNEIENKAIANSRYCKVGEHSHDCGCGDYKEGYKQALKDLL